MVRSRIVVYTARALLALIGLAVVALAAARAVKDPDFRFGLLIVAAGCGLVGLVNLAFPVSGR